MSTPIPAETPPVPGVSDLRIFGAEVIGTAVLMIIGPGSAIIALDVIGLNALSMYDLTTPQKALPNGIAVQMNEELSLVTNALDKKIQPGGTHAQYNEERMYISAEEHSVYKLFYHLKRV